MDRKRKKAFLTNHFVFDALSDGDIDLLLENTHSRKYVAEEVIFFKGDPTTGMMAVISGCVQIRIVSEEGKQLVLNTMREGEMLGEIGVLDGGDRTADAVAVEPTELLTIDRRAFLDLINKNPDFAMTLMEILCSRIRGTSEQAEDLALLDLRKRLAKKLLSLADEGKDGGKAIIGHSQQDLASLVGITRESINKHLAAWAKDGLIAVSRNEIEIVDEQGLRDIFEP